MWNSILRLRKKARITFTQLQLIYVIALFFALHSAIPMYANSEFLETFLSAKTVGVVFSVASLVGLFSLLNLPRFLRRFGIYKSASFILGLEIIALVTLGLTESLWLTIVLFGLFLLLAQSLFYMLDIFVENLSAPEHTGVIRGTLLTVLNTAVLVSPLILSFILGPNSRYRLMYLVSSALLIPPLILLARGFRKFKDPVYGKTEARKTTARILSDKDLFNIFACGFLLRFFYAWMIIYTPIYLISVIGFEWSVLGPILTFMLLPFVLFQIPLGGIADKFLGEQELLITGFIIMGVATMFLPFITTPNAILWALLLFTTRLGASFVEAMTESYFFKQVGPSDTSVIALFRTLSPLAYITAPIVSTITLLFIDIRYSFIALGFIMLTGIIYALGILDTK